MAQSPVKPTPATSIQPSTDQHILLSQSILRDLFGPPEQRSFAVRFWDGSHDQPTPAEPQFTLILRRPGALRRMLLPPSELAITEAYLHDDYDIEGSMEAVTNLAPGLVSSLGGAGPLARLAWRLRQLPGKDAPAPGSTAGNRAGFQGSGTQHSQQRDSAAVRYHYDTGNDFYALWLDSRMVYSCGYFQHESDDLDTAQKQKLEHICRKLRLKPGERLLDIGCGWGGLVRYAAEQYGVEALGITLSEAQAALARQRIAEAGLSERCRVEVRDYRALGEMAPFDKVVSVGMFEHVGGARLPEYFSIAYRMTKAGGLFLNHGIVSPASEARMPRWNWLTGRIWKSGSFIERYVFPDGETLPPRVAMHHAELAGFETRDVESLREHYALTLRHWVRRLEAHRDEAIQQVGETTYRVWRLYMSGSASGFASGTIGIIQALFSKPDASGRTNLPLTRADLYA
jgi:cyclopropane-fatty-acyl-phospholipid synthase